MLDDWTTIDHVRYDVIHPFLVPGPSPTKFALTVTASGSGTVTSAAAGINCGAACGGSYLPVNGWGCSNFDGRTVSVNGRPPTSTCGGGTPITPSADGFTYFIITAGALPYASLFTF